MVWHHWYINTKRTEGRKKLAVAICFEHDTEDLDGLLFGSTNLFHKKENQFLDVVNLKEGKTFQIKIKWQSCVCQLWISACIGIQKEKKVVCRFPNLLFQLKTAACLRTWKRKKKKKTLHINWQKHTFVFKAHMSISGCHLRKKQQLVMH